MIPLFILWYNIKKEGDMLKKFKKPQKEKRRARSKKARSNLKLGLKEIIKIANLTDDDMEVISIIGRKVTVS